MNDIPDIAVLSAQPEAYTTRRLLEELESAGASTRLLDSRRCSIGTEQEGGLNFSGRPLGSPPDLILPRVGPLMTLLGTTLLEHFEALGCRSTAPAAALSLAADKLRSLLALSRAGIPVPRTLFALDEDDVVSAVRALGGPPVVLKTLEGSAGRGVMLADSLEAAVALHQSLRAAGRFSLLQEYVPTVGPAADLRLLTARDEVLASMGRQHGKDDFRGNVHLGQPPTRHEASPREAELALQAARVIGLPLAGVDLLVGEERTLVLEVNASPGIEGLEHCTGHNVAAGMARVALELAALPREEP